MPSKHVKGGNKEREAQLCCTGKGASTGSPNRTLGVMQHAANSRVNSSSLCPFSESVSPQPESPETGAAQLPPFSA